MIRAQLFSNIPYIDFEPNQWRTAEFQDGRRNVEFLGLSLAHLKSPLY